MVRGCKAIFHTLATLAGKYIHILTIPENTVHLIEVKLIIQEDSLNCQDLNYIKHHNEWTG